jgi:hypothetical protein
MTLKSVRGDPLPWVSGLVSVLNAARNRAWVLACMLVVRRTVLRQENLQTSKPSKVASDIDTEMEACCTAGSSETTQFVNARLNGDRLTIGTSFAGVVRFEELTNA